MLQLQKYRFCLAVSCLMLTSFLFCSCQKEEEKPPPRPRVRSQSSGQGQVAEKEEPKIDYNKTIAVLETEKGTIEIDLLYDIAPKTVENFAKKVKGRRYNQAKFYRVEPKLLIQAGAPVFQTEELPIESSDRKHVRGTVAMAKEAGASVSSATDFYICLTELVLDEEYSVFGTVVKGMGVADKIVQGDKITLATLRTED
ncbi:MAG: peptidylprolyl isomerase [Candidatus Poribacteria bacterium]